MDRYVTRTPRERAAPKSQKPSAPRTTQATIAQLKGVVDMRVAARLREACLQTPLDTDGIRVTLEEIASKNVRHDIMQRLGIAKLLKRLQRCSDVHVAALAKDIVATWKQTLGEPTVRPKLQVKKGGEEERRRRRVRTHLADVFGADKPYKWEAQRPAERCALAVEAAVDAKAGHVNDGSNYLSLARAASVAFAGAPCVRAEMLAGRLELEATAKMEPSEIQDLERRLAGGNGRATPDA